MMTDNKTSGIEKVFYAEAPGRLDVMGGIADYSGSLVLQMPVSLKASVKLFPKEDSRIKISSQQFKENGNFEIPLKDLAEKDGSIHYRNAQTKLKQIKNGNWASYLVGCILVLIKEEKIDFRGADITLQSEVPPGKGVSSSAAIEMSTLKALKEAYAPGMNESMLPYYGQMAENLVAGAPCGLMDQLASFHGKAGYLLPILCQPGKLLPLMKIPDGVHFIGFDSGTKHQVSGSSYKSVRTAAFMGYTIIALEHGCKAEELKEAFHTQDCAALPFRGRLANITADEFKKLSDILPEKISGKSFEEKYGQIIDHVSYIDPEINYPVKNCTQHPVYEHDRISRFQVLFEKLENSDGQKEDYLTELGKLMIQSHHSYTACGLGHPSTDEIINMVMQEGGSKGLFGGRITGGGSGGTVCVLAYGEQGLDSLHRIKDSYEKKSGKQILLIS